MPMSLPHRTHDAPGSGAPARWLYLTDPPRASLEFGLLMATLPLSRLLPTGDGHPVLVLPGLLADDTSTWTLRRILRNLGYRVHGWRLGRNLGPTAAAVTGMADRLRDLYARYDTPVSLIGWSLGGIYARDLARRTPAVVREVITLGSPIRLEEHSQSRAGVVYNRFAHLHVVRYDLPLEHGVGALPVPATSIYSRYDGILARQACLDLTSPRAENIAVMSSHFGLGHHPAVIWAVADRLAQAPGQWAPFVAPPLLRALYRHADAPPEKQIDPHT